MRKRIIESVKDCKLVREQAIQNGHDCWGKLEWTEELYVYIGDKREIVHESMFIVHDGKEVEAAIYDWQLDKYKDGVKEEPKEEIIFNNKPCKNGCNCIEIAEEKNNNHPVKSYQCLNASKDDYMKLKAESPSEVKDEEETIEGVKENAKAWVDIYRKEANEAIARAKDYKKQIAELESKLHELEAKESQEELWPVLRGELWKAENSRPEERIDKMKKVESKFIIIRKERII